MRKSLLVLLAEKLANDYVEIDWPAEETQYLSIEYMLVAFMKIVDLYDAEGTGMELSRMDREELDALRERLEEKKSDISRNDIRTATPKPDEKADAYRRRIERIAMGNAQKAGKRMLTADYYLDAICTCPNGLVRKFLKPTLGEAAIGKMYSLARQKQELREHLLERVIGQDEAVEAFTNGVMSSVFYDPDEQDKRPRGIFVFAGPPGVGKTFLAETGAEKLGLPVKRFDMSEYSSDGADSLFKLIGTDKVWRAGHEGELTSFVRACNQEETGCFLIFDEIEKAHREVIYLFLQMLDAGRLTDKFGGYTVSLKDAYIVFTTNAGRSLYEGGKQIPRGLSKALIMDALREDTDPKTGKSYFPDAILSRFESGYAVMFRHLGAAELVKIGMKEMRKSAARFRQTYGPEVVIDEEIPFLLLLQKGGESDARSFRSESEKFISNQLMSIGEAVHEQRLNSVLRKNNRIRFTVNSQHRSQLDTLLGNQNDGQMLWVVSKDPDHLSDIRYAFQEVYRGCRIVSFLSAQEAAKGLKATAVCPDAVLWDFAEEEGGSRDTQKFAEKNPVVASTYQDFCAFLDTVFVHAPQVPVYALVETREQDRFYLAEAVRKRGAADAVLYAQMDEEIAGPLAETVRKRIRLAKLQEMAHRFARERKALTFTVSPNEENQEVVIRLANFKKSTLTAGKDADAMLSEDRMPSVTFDDYIGGEETKREIKEFVTYLQNPGKYLVTGEQQPKGVLLYGPPGTGKTFLAKAMAHEAGVPFFSTNGSSFVTELHGSGPKAIRELFATARKYAPAIVFIDEVDAIARKRTGYEGNRPQEETLNMLLSQMDGFDTDAKRPVFVIAATNYGIDQRDGMALDPALVRRFTRTILVDLPNLRERLDYLKHRLKDHSLSLSEAFLESVAKRSVGMNYGNLSNVIDKAVRDARKAGQPLTEAVLDDALETILYGEKKDWGAESLERVAWHEAGHAYMNWKCGRTPEYITITARGNFGGYVMPASTEDKMLWTKTDMMDRVRLYLAGRAAEILRYGDREGLSTGPYQDIRQAGQLLTKYVCDYGMDEKLGMVYLPDPNDPPTEIRERIRELLRETADSVLEELTQKKDSLQRFVDRLLEANKLTAWEIEELLGEVE